MKQVCFPQIVYFLSYVWAQRWLFSSEVGKLLAGHYSARSGRSSNLYFLTGYRILTGQKAFLVLGSFLEIPQGYVTAYAIINGQ